MRIGSQAFITRQRHAINYGNHLAKLIFKPDMLTKSGGICTPLEAFRRQEAHFKR